MKKDIISYFKEISRIPRKSGDEKRISDYLVSFARKNSLEAVQDEFCNVIIKKPASHSGNQHLTVILQCHMDMVYEKHPASAHCYEDGIRVLREGDFLYGDGTTLGADNGIAVAYCLALLEAGDIPHPNLEVVVTTREECGLVGAQNLDISKLKGKYLINLDAEEEGVFFTSCAGGLRNILRIPGEKVEIRETRTPVEVSFQDMTGGHSGLEIHLEYGNAIRLLGRILYGLEEFAGCIGCLDFPGQANAIASKGRILYYVNEEERGRLSQRIGELEAVFQEELAFTDHIRLQVAEQLPVESCQCYPPGLTERLGKVLMLFPQGVIHMSHAIEGLVETSANMGALTEKDGNLELLSSLRSSVQSQKYCLRDQIAIIAEAFGLECEFMSDYPTWNFRAVSPLRELAMKTYQELFGKEGRIEAIHAGLECGYWAGKFQDIDIISLGASLYDVHTVKEKASVTSVEHMWEYLCMLMKKL